MVLTPLPSYPPTASSSSAASCFEQVGALLEASVSQVSLLWVGLKKSCILAVWGWKAAADYLGKYFRHCFRAHLLPLAFLFQAEIAVGMRVYVVCYPDNKKEHQDFGVNTL